MHTCSSKHYTVDQDFTVQTLSVHHTHKLLWRKSSFWLKECFSQTSHRADGWKGWVGEAESSSANKILTGCRLQLNQILVADGRSPSWASVFFDPRVAGGILLLLKLVNNLFTFRKTLADVDTSRRRLLTSQTKEWLAEIGQNSCPPPEDKTSLTDGRRFSPTNLKRS